MTPEHLHVTRGLGRKFGDIGKADGFPAHQLLIRPGEVAFGGESGRQRRPIGTLPGLRANHAFGVFRAPPERGAIQAERFDDETLGFLERRIHLLGRQRDKQR